MKSSMMWFAFVVVTSALATGSVRAQTASNGVLEMRGARRGPFETHSVLEDWRDETRERPVPVMLRFPAGKGPFPVIVFSHGLGGNRWNYAYIGDHWASHGYVVVHVQHLGSDEAVWKSSSRPLRDLRDATKELDNLIDRPRDVSFVLDELERRAARGDWLLTNKLDLDHIGVAGHSFGAYTALCSAGRLLVAPLGGSIEPRDERIRACVAMSPQGSERERRNGSWSRFECPVLHMTGTRDTSPITPDVGLPERRLPFDSISNAEQVLLILADADHMAFGDAERARAGSRDPAHWTLIRASSTAFFDAYLRGSAEARVWLRDGAFARELGPRGTLEVKSPNPSQR